MTSLTLLADFEPGGPYATNPAYADESYPRGFVVESWCVPGGTRRHQQDQEWKKAAFADQYRTPG